MRSRTESPWTQVTQVNRLESLNRLRVRSAEARLSRRAEILSSHWRAGLRVYAGFISISGPGSAVLGVSSGKKASLHRGVVQTQPCVPRTEPDGHCRVLEAGTVPYSTILYIERHATIHAQQVCTLPPS